MTQADRRGGACNRVLDRALLRIRRRRRRDVDRLFEERAVERIGFVENREHAQRAVVHQRFDRVLASRNEGFDERRVVRVVAFRADVGRLYQRMQPFDGGGELAFVVGAHHATAAGQRHRLDDAREATSIADC